MLEFYEPQADFGTPESTSTQLVTLRIDGVEVTVPEGTSVMRAAAESGAPDSAAARITDVPSGTVTSTPSIRKVTNCVLVLSGVPKSACGS